MANYDRRFLIPYLRDLYSLELLLTQQRKEREKLSHQLQSQTVLLNHDIQPKAEEKQSAYGVIALWLAAFGLCCCSGLFAMLAITRDDRFWTVAITLLVLGLLAILLLLYQWLHYQKKAKKYTAYRQQLLNYQEQAPLRQQKGMQITALQEQLEALTQTLQEGTALRQTLYGINVIPSHYRSLPAVRFLFEYFLSSKAEDVDAVVQIYAVESLRNGADKGDERRNSAMLRHRLQLAQQQADEKTAREYEERMLQLAQQEPNPERRSQYQKMVREGLALSRYFEKYR